MPAKRVDLERIGRGELVILHMLAGLRAAGAMPLAASNRKLLGQELSDVHYLLEYVNTTTRRLKRD